VFFCGFATVHPLVNNRFFGCVFDYEFGNGVLVLNSTLIFWKEKREKKAVLTAEMTNEMENPSNKL
jgi:hypothetical protein